MRGLRPSIVAVVGVGILLSADASAECELALKTSPDLQVTDYASLPPGSPFRGPSAFPSLAWSGTTYAVAFRHLGHNEQWIELARLDTTPRRLESDTRVANAETGGGNEAVPALVWTGAEFAVAYSGGTNYVRTSRIDESGGVTGLEFVPADPPTVEISQGVALAWSGAGFGLGTAYEIPPLNEGRSRIDLRPLDPTGRPGESAPPEIETILSGCPSWGDRRCLAIAWTGSEYGLAFEAAGVEGADILFVRADASGVRRGATLRLSNAPGESGFPELVWTGTEYAAAWAETGLGGIPQIAFARIDSDGNPVGDPVQVTHDPWGASWPELVPTGDGLALFWERFTDAAPQIAFARLDPSGRLSGPAVTLTTDPRGARRPSAVRSGSRFAVAWERNSEIDFAQIGCGKVDVRPDNPRNPVNLRGNGRVPVAILGSATLDVGVVEPASLRFGPWGAPPEHDLSDPRILAEHLGDVDGDGFEDLVVHFRIPATGIRCGDETALLTGTSRFGQDFAVPASITTEGCR